MMSIFSCSLAVGLLVACLLFLTTSCSGHPSVEDSSSSKHLSNDEQSDEFLFRDDFFEDDFEELTRQQTFHGKIDEGLDLWEDKCLKVGGQEALDSWLEAQEMLLHCVMENFDVMNIPNEIELRKATGDLDMVFKKYCGVPVQKTRPCLEKFVAVSRGCLNAKDQAGLNHTMNIIDVGLDFICHNSGDRIALFMAVKGVECVKDRQEELLMCVNKSTPEFFQAVSTASTSLTPRRRSVDPVIVFNYQNCRRTDDFRKCVENELLECQDPTPSNVINALLLAMWKTTPCPAIYEPLEASKANKLVGFNYKVLSGTKLSVVLLIIHVILKRLSK